MGRKIKALVLGPQKTPAGPLHGPLEEAFREVSVDRVSVAETMGSGAPWSIAIDEAMRQADVIVADMSSPSPNLFYELGIARSLRKPTVVLLSTEAKGELPPDVTSYQIVTYDPTNLSSFKTQISRVLSYQASKLAD